MTQSDERSPQLLQDVALIVGGGPGISSSCARLFAKNGMRVGIAARNPDKSVLQAWRSRTACVDMRAMQANQRPWSCCSRTLFETLARLRFWSTTSTAGFPASSARPLPTRSRAWRSRPFGTRRSARSWRVGRPLGSCAKTSRTPAAQGTIIFTNASAALKGFPSSGAFAMACHAKSGLAQSMARELMPQGIHVANVPIDSAIGWTQDDGTRAHRRAGTTVDDNMADPDCIAETYLQLHCQHRSTWAFEVALRPWVERW